MTQPIISLRDVGFTYSIRKGLFHSTTYTALRSVSFDIHRGETVGLIGRNGCGKSTLLRLLAQISKPDQGSITFAKGITATLLTLQAGFDQELPGRDNVILSGMLLGMPYQVIRSRLNNIIEFAGIGSFIDEPLKTYSDGMRARLGFALALELAPEVILVDEVLGVGDAAFLHKAKNAMQHKLTSSQTVVYVSHDLQSVAELCDTVVWIEKGEARKIGKPAEVIEAYLTTPCTGDMGQSACAADGQRPEPPADPERDHVPPAELGTIVTHAQGLETITECLASLKKLPVCSDMGILVVSCHGPSEQACAIHDWAQSNWPGGAAFLPRDGKWADARDNFLDKPCHCLVLDNGPELNENQARNAAIRLLLEIPGLSWAWLLSSAVTVEPGAPISLLRHMVARPKSLIGASIEDAATPGRLKCAGGFVLSPWSMSLKMASAGLPREEALQQAFERLDAVYGGCMAVPLRAFRTIGLLDEELSPDYAVLDLCTRATQEGYSLEWCSNALARTGPTSLAALPKELEFEVERALIEDLRSAMVYTRRRQPWLMPWIFARRALCGAVMWALRGKWRLAKGYCTVLTQWLGGS